MHFSISTSIGKAIASLSLAMWLCTGTAQADMVYSARNGDTVDIISARHGVSTRTILQANPRIKNSSTKLDEGLIIIIPDSDKEEELMAQADAEPPVPGEIKLDPNALAELSRAGDRYRNSQLASRGGAVVRSAHRYLGTPYVFGATGNGAFDCSGFVMKVFAQHGINLPRTADVQFNVGTKVARGQEVPGDLVFFETYLPGPSHVGIYLGNNKFIHASSSRGVTISSLGSSYYSARYLGAKRVFR